MESSQIFGEQFMNLLKEQAKEAYLEGVKDGKKSLKTVVLEISQKLRRCQGTERQA